MDLEGKLIYILFTDTIKCCILLISIVFCFQGCDSLDKEPPVSKFEIVPPIGDSLTVFYIDASSVYDNYTPTWQLQVRWDFNNDQQWDTDFSITKDYSVYFPLNGRYRITCEVMDEVGNTSISSLDVFVQPVPRDSQFLDARTLHEFNAVLLFDRWWMAENLIFGTALSQIQDPIDDTIAEYYSYPGSSKYGGFYTWSEATRGGSDTIMGICPKGWRLPRPDDVDAINDLAFIHDQSQKYFFEDGLLGTNFQYSGRYIATSNIWDGQGERLSFWLNNGIKPQNYRTWLIWQKSALKDGFKTIYEGNQGMEFFEGWNKEWGSFSYKKVALPVRCVKDLQR